MYLKYHVLCSNENESKITKAFNIKVVIIYLKICHLGYGEDRSRELPNREMNLISAWNKVKMQAKFSKKSEQYSKKNHHLRDG